MTVPNGFTNCNTEDNISRWLLNIEALVQGERWRTNKANIVCVAQHLARCFRVDPDRKIITAEVTKRHIAEISGISPSTVLRVLKLLESYSMLQCEATASMRSRSQASLWIPLLPAAQRGWTKSQVTTTSSLSTTPPYRFSTEKPSTAWSNRKNAQVKTLEDSRNNVWHGHRNAWLIFVVCVRSPGRLRVADVRRATGLGRTSFTRELAWLLRMGILNFLSQSGLKDDWVLDSPWDDEKTAWAHHASGPDYLREHLRRIEAEREIHRRWIAGGCKTKVMQTLKWRQQAASFKATIDAIAAGMTRAQAALEGRRAWLATT